MFIKDNSTEESNFWISYADLMAGLLFVFILLIGAIISKSIIAKLDLQKKEIRLENLAQDLEQKKILLLQTQNRVGEQDNSLSKNERLLKLKDDEIIKLNNMLLQANTREDSLSNRIVIVQNLLTKKDDDIKKDRDKHKKNMDDYKGQVLILSNQLTDNKNQTTLKDKEMLTLLNALDEKKTKYDSLVENLQAQKAKIRSLTGIKLKVIASLKEALGDNIDIDRKNGSLKVASNVLFGSGNAKLKVNAKKELKKAFEEYIGALVSDQSIKSHIDKIIIEGHTDSVGSYIYNLNLSQKRALAVMEYLLTLNFTKKHNLKSLLTASGRGYLDNIVINGVENREASRRIEIKFRLKNEDAMAEIEKVLDEN